MAEPWFEAANVAWIPGTLLGMSGALLGMLMGTLAPAGRGKHLVMGIAGAVVVSAAASLLVAVLAWVLGQPWPICFMFGHPGILGLVIILPLISLIRRIYRDAESRRMAARDLE